MNGALPISIFRGQMPGDMAREWDVGRGQDAMSRAEERMRDPDEIHARLDRATPLALVALEVVVEAGGCTLLEPLAAVLRERTGQPESICAPAFDELSDLGLAVQIEWDQTPGVALLDPSAATIADAVFGVTLPPPPPDPITASAASAADAATVAAATMALHHRVMATKDGWVHRGNVKKHARRLEMDAGDLEARLESASAQGALVARDGRFELDTESLVNLSRGGGTSPALATLLADGPVCAELLVRQRARSVVDPNSRRGRSLALVRKTAQLLLEELPGVARTQRDGTTWVSLATLDELPEGAVEGFITPSLDVMIGPDPDARLVARVGLGADLVRLDRVITFRLRPKTVARMVALGMAVEDLLEALAKIGKHGVPDSVRAQILDWGARAKVVNVSPVALLRVPEAQHDAAARVVGSSSLGSLGPGVLVVPHDSVATLRPRLEESGFDVMGELPPLRSESEALYDAEPSPGDDFARWPLGSPSPAPHLLERVRRAMKEGFAASREHLLESMGLDFDGLSAAETREALRAMVDTGLPASAQKAIDLMLKVHNQLEGQLHAWASGYDEPWRSEAIAWTANPLICLPFLCVAPRHRRRLLESEAPPDEVIEDAAELMARRKLSPEGRRIFAALAKPDLAQWVDRILGGDLASDEPPPNQSASERQAVLRRAASSEHPVELWWSTPTGTQQAVCWIDEIGKRGKREVVLFTEPHTDFGRAVPLGDVLAARPLPP